MSTDQAICLLESRLGPAYESIIHNRTGPPTRFEISGMIRILEKEKESLTIQRKELCQELANKSAEACSTRGTFGHNLVRITAALNRAEIDSKQLAEFTAKLSVDFTHITDRLDSATSLVSRAGLISSYLTDIAIYDSSQDFERVKEDLKKKTLLSFAEEDEEFADKNYAEKMRIRNVHKTSEYIAKLLKIADIAEKQNVARVALANLQQHQSILAVRLLAKFNSGTTKVDELKSIARSLNSLGLGEVSINNFIGMTAVFHSLEGANLLYSDELCREPTSRILDHFDAYCSFVSNECIKQWPIIDSIFERPTVVKQKFIKKVSCILQLFVTGVLSYYYGACPRDYCTMFASLYERSSEMLDIILNIDKQEVTTKIAVLDDLFIDHQKGYGAFEIMIFMKELTERTQLKEQLLDKAMKPLGFFRKAEDEVDPIALFEYELFPEMISLMKQTMSRCAIIAPPEQVSITLKKLSKIFLEDHFGPLIQDFIRAGQVYLQQNQEKIENIPRFLKMIMLINSNILSLEEVYMNTLKHVFLPFAGVHSSFLRQKEQLIEKLENETVDGLKVCIESIKVFTLKTLDTNQKRLDFLPAEDSLPTISEACQKYCPIMKKIIMDIGGQMWGENRAVFMASLGKAIIDTIVDHFCGYKYNTQGGMNLMMDVTEYQHVLELMEVQQIDDIGEDLVKVAHLMATASDLLPDVARNQTMSKRAMNYAKRLLILRQDSKDFCLLDVFPMG
ncbi:hypothetical protein TRFO_39234 [Tritrichomonas foetus]|uniref:Exocyst complex component Sec10-like alpha-helical bundle domain-containing protein n=1 Tax=Tritrichomonas foetus TaxID=1144522 RepID=A0A1J4J7D1_9EUKA|nr:hypothetical protein TRFO_39234 [Tritrichomonas foetus]|eukprot:OHS94577.1 hypothetical protein TRFO_39234 [Tritrichomonas foetus]